MHGFVGEQSVSKNLSQADGLNKKRAFVDRFATNIEEFNKVWDEGENE